MKYKIAGFILIVFATIKVFADLLGFTQLSAVAAVTNAAPAMKVFTAIQGYEAYSADFEIAIRDSDQFSQSTMLTPENYSGLKGPYNRRNVYGALIAAGPVLITNTYTQAAWHEIAQKSFCQRSDLLNELGYDTAQKPMNVLITYHLHVENTHGYPQQIEVYCEE